MGRARRLLISILLCSAAGAAGAAPPRNVVLVSIDSLRADHLPFRGYPRMTAPFLSRLVEQQGAVVFERASAASPACGPAHAALLTGRHPQRLGVPYGGEDLIARRADFEDGDALERLTAYQDRLRRSAAPLVQKKVRSVEGWLSLPEGTPTLAARLAEERFETAAFVSHWTLGARFGYDAGFDRYDDETPEYTGPESLVWMLRDTFRSHRRRAAAATVDRTLEFLAARSDDRPFFLFVHLADLHEPVAAPAEATFDKASRTQVEPAWQARYTTKAYRRAMKSLDHGGDHLLDRYDDAIRATDALLEKLAGALEASGELSRTLLVITADHGQAFGEHAHGAEGEGAFFDHGVHVWEEVLDVPLLIVDPAAPPGPARRQDNVSPVDLAPTILAALGLDAGGLPGRDLRGAAEEDGRVYFSSFGVTRPGLFRDLFFEPPRLLGFRDKDLKFVIDAARFEDEDAGHAFLFQLGVDPSERNDVSAHELYRPHAQRYRKELLRWYQESIAPDSSP